MMNGHTMALPTVQRATSGILTAALDYIVPIASASAGFLTGGAVAYYAARMVYDWVPLVTRLDGWIVTRAKDVNIVYLFAGAGVIASTVVIDYLIAAVLGDDKLTRFLRRAVTAYVFGVGLRCIVEGFGPLKSTIEVLGAELPAADVNGDSSSGTVNAGTPFEDAPTPAPVTIKPAPDPSVQPITPGTGTGSGDALTPIKPTPPSGDAQPWRRRY